jgi:hypothetical protein
MKYASDETKAMAKYTPQEYGTLTALKEEQRNIIGDFFEGEDGLNRLEVLVSDDYFKELNPGFEGINFDRNNPDEARKQATELTLAALASGTKPDKNAEGTATGVNNPAYANMKELQTRYLNTPMPNRAVRFPEDDRVYTIGSKNAELTLKPDGWFLQSKQPDGTVLYNKYTDVDDILRRNSNLFN